MFTVVDIILYESTYDYYSSSPTLILLLLLVSLTRTNGGGPHLSHPALPILVHPRDIRLAIPRIGACHGRAHVGFSHEYCPRITEIVGDDVAEPFALVLWCDHRHNFPVLSFETQRVHVRAWRVSESVCVCVCDRL